MIYRKQHIRSFAGRCAGLLAGLLALASCSTITEELPPCKNYVQFCYDRNMHFVDAFPVQVKRIHLYVFDAAGKFVTLLADEQDFFGEGYRMALPELPAGDYRLIAWAGLYEDSYACRTALEPGVSMPEDICVKMRREADCTQCRELDALWHGEARMSIPDGESRTETIRLTKNTNRFRIIVQGEGDLTLRQEELDFTIRDCNGHLNYDNTLLADDEIGYKPYYKADADLSAQTKAEGGISAVAAELNTLRLMEDADARLTITHSSGETLVDIDLIRYLLLTKMEGHDMSAQEYLDRQDEYAMIFFLNKDVLGNYMLMYIQVNGWTIRPQDGNL